MNSLLEREKRINDLAIEAGAEYDAVLWRELAESRAADIAILREMNSILLEQIAASTGRERRLRERVNELLRQARETGAYLKAA